MAEVALELPAAAGWAGILGAREAGQAVLWPICRPGDEKDPGQCSTVRTGVGLLQEAWERQKAARQ